MPWLPPDAATTPAGGTSRSSRLANAPRALNEPACCRSSSLKSTCTPATPRSAPSTSMTGVRRTNGWICRYVSAIAARSILTVVMRSAASETSSFWRIGKIELALDGLKARLLAQWIDELVHLQNANTGVWQAIGGLKPIQRLRDIAPLRIDLCILVRGASSQLRLHRRKLSLRIVMLMKLVVQNGHAHVANPSAWSRIA